MENLIPPDTTTAPLIRIKELFNNADFTPLFKHLDTLSVDQREECCSNRKTFNVCCVWIRCINCPLRQSNRYLYELYRNGTPHSEIFSECAEDYNVQECDLIRNLSKYPIPLAQLIYDETIKYTSGKFSIKAMQMYSIDHLFEFDKTPQGMGFWSNVLREKWEFIDEQYHPALQPSATTVDHEISQFPVEIINKMLDEQELQGNTRDINVFKLNGREATYRRGGFNWGNTADGFKFWSRVINEVDFDLFFTKYPKISATPANTTTVLKIQTQDNYRHINAQPQQENTSNTNYNYEPLKFKTNGKFTHL